VGSVNHPKLYDPAAMASIKAAFSDIWNTLQAQDAIHGEESAAELKAAIIRRLIGLVADGTTSPEELKAKILTKLNPPARGKADPGPF
jgi:hypothetical protein